jgi:hypothetical protein
MLRHANAQTGERGRSVVIGKIATTSHGLHEILTGVAAPGAGQLVFLPHEHCYVGTPLARNAQYCADHGQHIAVGKGLRWALNNSVDYWTPIDGGQDKSYDVSSNKRYVDFPSLIQAYATPRVDSDSTAVGAGSNPCRFRVFGLITADAATTLRFYNRTRNEVSATISLPGGYQEFDSTIPVSGGRVNEIDVEALGTTGRYVIIHQITVAETRSLSQPESAGTTLYTTATRP